jgi:[citrate (pro-3S)-lyase] ligase
MFGINVSLFTPPSPEEEKIIKAFLEEHGLVYEGKPDASVIVEDPQGRVIATGSLSGKVLKMLAIDQEWREANLSGTIMTRLIEYGRSRGLTHFFVFTKPDVADKFLSFGFRELARYKEYAAVLEMGHPGVDHFKKYLLENKKELEEGKTAGAVVVNCNPFTRGHQYLIEQASRAVDFLYVIVVEADLSSFPFKHRFELVKQGTAHLDNVTVIRSGDYAVSPATFPSYFMKGASVEKIASIQARLDVTLFANLFVPTLQISKRFVGTEPYCAVTSSYNEAMKEILPARGVELVEIPRLTTEDGMVVSASTVRDLIRKDDWENIKKLVPQSTWNYLVSDEAKDVLEKIKKGAGRH